ncbi:hypothetical protein [Wolinella succinogenes]|nr:hypothetical protein [Wolinella succinogenes]
MSSPLFLSNPLHACLCGRISPELLESAAWAYPMKSIKARKA